MRRGMIGIAAIGALLLLAGSIPGDADAARNPSVKVTQNTKSQPGSIVFTAKGGGFDRNQNISVLFIRCTDNDCDERTTVFVTTSRTGSWSAQATLACGFRYLAVEAYDLNNDFIAGNSGNTNPAC